MLIFLLYY